MKNMSTRVIFFGNERLVSGLSHTDAPVLMGLIKHGYDIQAIISHYSTSRSRNQRSLEVAEIGRRYDIPVLLPHNPIDIMNQIIEYNAEIAVLAAYGRIIPQQLIDVFPKGIVNLHPSLLPKYRGPTPIESAIENGDSKTGVSIMQLTAGMDAGPIYAQKSIQLSGTETKFDVCDTLSQIGADLLLSVLPKIIDGSLQPTPQDSSKATYSQLLHKSDALLNTDHLTAIEAERKIRAHLEFPKTKITISDNTIIITKAHVSQTQQSLLDIKCKDKNFLSIDELIAPSGKKMDRASFLRGYAA